MRQSQIRTGRVLTLTIRIDLEPEEGVQADPNARTRSVGEPPYGAQAHDPNARTRSVGEYPNGAQAQQATARVRAVVSANGAQAQHTAARVRADGAPRALNKENQSVSLLSSEMDRSIDPSAREEGQSRAWSIPGQDHPLCLVLSRETGMPYSDPNVPDLVTLFRRHEPGRVFAAFLALVEERGGANQGAMNAHTDAEWSHERTRAALQHAGVLDADAAGSLACVLCPRTVAALHDRRQARDANERDVAKRERRGFKPIDNVARWFLRLVQNGHPYEAALTAAKHRHEGRTKAADERNGRQLAANASKIDAKTRREQEARDAEARKLAELDQIRAATDRQLREALDHLVNPGGRRTNVVCTKAARALIAEQLAAGQTPRDVARLDRVRPYVVCTLTTPPKEPARG